MSRRELQTGMEGETRITIPTRIGMDVATLVGALPLALLSLGTCLYVLIFPGDVEPFSGPKIPGVSRGVSDVTLLCLVLIALTIWLCARGFGALLRALDRRPMLEADGEGLRFHPTLCREVLRWSDISRIRETEWIRPYKLEFVLRRRIWAIESPLTARRIHIGALHLDNYDWVPQDLIERLERLRRPSD